VRQSAPYWPSSWFCPQIGLVDDNNLYEWEILVIGCVSCSLVLGIATHRHLQPSGHVVVRRHSHLVYCAINDSIYSEGGFFKALLTFPPEFPLLPPKMRFITPMWHPNSRSFSFLPEEASSTFLFIVYADGVVCVSILVSRSGLTPTSADINLSHLARARGRSIRLRRCWWEVDACSYRWINRKPFTMSLCPKQRFAQYLILMSAAYQCDIPLILRYTKPGQSSQCRCCQGSSNGPRKYAIRHHSSIQILNIPIAVYKKKVRRLVRRSAEEAFDWSVSYTMSVPVHLCSPSFITRITIPFHTHRLLSWSSCLFHVSFRVFHLILYSRNGLKLIICISFAFPSQYCT